MAIIVSSITSPGEITIPADYLVDVRTRSSQRSAVTAAPSAQTGRPCLTVTRRHSMTEPRAPSASWVIASAGRQTRRFD